MRRELFAAGRVVASEPPQHYQPFGACSGCEYSTHCHEARQQAMDLRGIGRHTSCPFYVEFRRLEVR